MKQGSADDPFADDPDDAGSDPSGASSTDTTEQRDRSTAAETGTNGTTDRATGDSSASEDRPARQSLPYIHSRDGVKDGRTQRPVFLRDHVENGIDDLVAEMESELGEDVYKTDVTEAAMVVAQKHPELVLETLEEWGYGWA